MLFCAGVNAPKTPLVKEPKPVHPVPSPLLILPKLTSLPVEDIFITPLPVVPVPEVSVAPP